MPDNNWRQQQALRQTRQDVLQAIEDLTGSLGYSPTRAEIAVRLKISEISVRRHIKALIEEGLLTEGKGPRTLRVE